MPRPLIRVAVLAVLAVAFAACGTVGHALRIPIEFSSTSKPAKTADMASIVAVEARETSPSAVAVGTASIVDVEARDTSPSGLSATDYRLQGADATSDASTLLAQTGGAAADASDEEYDPWEPFNEKMFEFNRRLDRYVLKPVAKGYNVVVPDQVQVMIANVYDNAHFVPRMMNSLFQRKWDGAARELGRFMLNSTVGIGGLFDVARQEVEPTLGNKVPGIEKSREDFGQTLGFYGTPPGPYLILPFMEPLTVRDGIGRAVDHFMDPSGYFTPFWVGLVIRVEETINDRSLNLELFQGFEESVIDMYSAVRHGYLKRREKLIQE